MCLNTPVIPFDCFPKDIPDPVDTSLWVKNVFLPRLPSIHLNVFLYIMSFLKFVLSRHKVSSFVCVYVYGGVILCV